MPQCKDVTDTKLVLEPYQVIIRPIVTEKAFHISATRNTYTFEVNKLASKLDVKDAIEALYDVKVVAVSTQNRQGKKRRTRKGVGCTKSWKKAMVKLDDEYRLDLY
ncbi:MAG: 50S ribosomal protein L23 [Thermoguttaceae bacterium]|nr:50S ribosomal protein L23 [Thermoguttaceae bacterium]MBQ7029889.1 50S ribosomal protein L23 [Thermoguttaceae bacterium]